MCGARTKKKMRMTKKRTDNENKSSMKSMEQNDSNDITKEELIVEVINNGGATRCRVLFLTFKGYAPNILISC